MAHELIVTEKPASAKKIADALAEGKAIKESLSGVPYYKVTHKGKDIVVASAVGHIFGLAEREKGAWTYPVYDVVWKPMYEVSKNGDFTKKYINALKKLTKDATSFVVATDFDIEGEVIGLNVIRHVCKQEDAHRMKFSTLTKGDLVKSYANKQGHLDWGQALAGETRHKLDWYYGINLSRALTLSVRRATGKFKLLSIGRVQGPALKIVCAKERSIQAFKSEPYWQLQLITQVKDAVLEAWHKEDKFWEEEKATQIFEKIQGKNATVADVSKRETKAKPPHPFDLTSMQIEAYRTCKINPKEALAIAQSLYTDGVISYPRTSSQQLPKEIGYETILKALTKQKEYADLCMDLLNTKLEPNNGKKTDAAHPAIYPTGEVPKSFKSAREKKIYDLIVRRFMATFGPHAVRETMTITMEVEEEPFLTKGTRTKDPGWYVYYGPFVMLDSVDLPKVEKGDTIMVKDANKLAKQTQPPKRYTPASLVKELEKKGLGTKATRAVIVENLYNRGYISEQSITVSALGLKTDTILEKFTPAIVDEKLTRHFEDEMEAIREQKKKNDDVLKEAQKRLNEILTSFKEQEKEVGLALSDANKESVDAASLLGKCPQCEDGSLVIKRSKFGRFAGCTKYPECKATYGLPKTGMVKPTDQACQECSSPVVQVIERRQKPRMVCINPKCPTWRPGYKPNAKAD